jgi:Rieske Fe-S protein
MADESSKRPEKGRRGFLKAASGTAMAAGLVGGYGAFAAIAGRFLYPPSGSDRQWQFVTEEASLAVGDSILYRTPSGETVSITRKERNGDERDFIALSSTCPHLGCQVHWEAQNNRYFCPCHNGVFDADGIGIEGPPGDAGQTLPQYPLMVHNGLLMIEVKVNRLAEADDESPAGEIVEPVRIAGPGHDPCLGGGGNGRRRA